MSELAENGLVDKTGQKKGTRYQAKFVEQANYDQQSAAHTHEGFARYLSVPARKAIDDVRQPIFTRSPVTYNDDWIGHFTKLEAAILQLQVAHLQRGVELSVELSRAYEVLSDNHVPGVIERLAKQALLRR